MVAQFQIQQCLHGYDDGHELLASSVKFGSQDAYVLSQLSDLSGQNAPKEISGYITGYPLEGAPYYVLARTWLAYELPRPGCAWTHSLLIDNGDLSALVSAQKLLNLFHRPEVLNGEPNRSYYEVPITAHEEMFRPGPDVGDPQDRLEALIRGLYQAPGKKIFFVSNGSENHAHTLLSIWSQQWPKLRRSFRFCSGSLQDRSDTKLKFDLQILVQPRALSSILNDTDAVVLDRSSVNVKGEREEGWIRDVAADIRSPSISGLRKFLWRYGPDTKGGRENFRQLASVFHSLSVGDVISVNKAVDTLSQDSSQFETLIRHIFEGPPHPTSTLGIPQPSPFVLLQVLLKTPLEALTPALIEKVARSAFKEVGPREVLSVLSSCDSQSRAWGAAARVAIEDYVGKGPVDGARIIETLVPRNASLLGVDAVWRTSPQVLETVLSQMETDALSSEVVRAASCAAFRAGRSRIVYYFLKQDAEAAVFGLMDAADASGPNFDYRSLCRLLEDYETEVVAWLKQRNGASVESLAMILDLVGYDLAIVRSVTPTIWEPLARCRSLWSWQALVQAKSTLLVAALSSESWTDGGLWAVGSFESVHNQLMKDDLPWRLWSQIRSHVPELSWRDNWDKAERLRHAVLDRFASEIWPLDKFFEVVSSNEALEAMLSSALLSVSQFEVLKAVFQNLKTGRFPLPEWLGASALKMGEGFSPSLG